MSEIEHRFLVTKPAAQIIAEAQALGQYHGSVLIFQSYLEGTGDWAIRCRRIKDGEQEKYFLTMKQPKTIIEAEELETEVSKNFFDEMAALCRPPLVKRRAKILVDGLLWELDSFLNPELDDLEIVEVEVPTVDTQFAQPSWVGLCLNNSQMYKNVNLAKDIKSVFEAV